MVGQAPRSGSVDWLPCRDGKYRPVEGGTFPLAHEDSARVGRLRAYGNALDAATAQAFIGVWMEAMQ
jgi:DNA (cytosine-5)-methyltransferase 1